MGLTPIGVLRISARAALRRRFGYAGLRVMRRGVRRAIKLHRERTLDVSRPYSTSIGDLRQTYFAAMARIRRRWPRLDPSDPRAEP